MAGSVPSLDIDPAAVADDIASGIRSITQSLGRRGAVVGLSGGVDSAVTAALCVRALGKESVLAVLTPERESSPETLSLSKIAAEKLGIEWVLEDITPILEASGCYSRRDAAISELLPAYGAGWRVKLVLSSVLEDDRYRFFALVAESPTGERSELRLPAAAYRQIVAATSFKQRSRKMVEYYHADLRSFAVVGTPNRLEYDQGFFVKNGDAAADIKPIAHLFKTQVYQLAEYFDIPAEIRSRPPTTDTYSLDQSQEEFYFSLPHDQLDACLAGLDDNVPAEQIADALGLTYEQMERVLADIERKRAATRYLHAPPQLVHEVKGIPAEAS